MSNASSWSKQHKHCFLCGKTAQECWTGLETHHIARGCNRAKAKNELCALIRTCPLCHEKRLDGMRPVVQYAIKLMFDHIYYNRVELNRLRGRADNAITDDDVSKAFADLVVAGCNLKDGYPFPKLKD